MYFMKKVLFVCVHNSGRSQMAEAFFNQRAPAGWQAESAGTMPAQDVNPLVVQVMKEVGLDISHNQPKLLVPEMLTDVKHIFTMGCDVDSGLCPAGFLKTEDWGLEDPAGKPNETVRKIRDDIRTRVEKLIKELGD
jgi:arsenate reductase